MSRIPPTIAIGDRIRIGRTVHEVVSNRYGKRGIHNWINNLGSKCKSHKFHDLDKRRTLEATTCLMCLGDADDG